MPYKLPWPRRGVGAPAGFTLIELITGIVVLAIGMVVIVSFLVPLARRGIDPVYQFRAASIGQSLMNEILSKSYDENSDHTGGGLWRCGETTVDEPLACTASASYGNDDESRAYYNDVDDYSTNGEFIAIDDSLGQDLSDIYRNYTYKVAIDSSEQGESQAKRVDLWIKDPAGQTYAFSAYRWNY